MLDRQLEPGDNDSIECHLQQIGMGTLICRAARQSGDRTTNEVTPSICFNCPVGRVFREVGCDAMNPKIRIYQYLGGESEASIENLFCKTRKRDTSLEHCRACNLVVGETTRQIVTTTRGLFQAKGFYSSYKDLEKARKYIRDGQFDAAITRSVASLESTMRICHEKLGKPLPEKKQVTDLWKSTRTILDFDALDSLNATQPLMGSLSGVVSNLGMLRNVYGDAHGKGTMPSIASEILAELAINAASAMSTAIVRRFNQVMGSEPCPTSN